MSIKLENINSVLERSYTAMFASASYEERSVSIISHIFDHIIIDKKYVSLSTPHKQFIQKNLSLFIDKFGFMEIEISNLDQLRTAGNIINAIAEVIEYKKNANFLIDITTFTRQTLLILIRLLRNILNSENKIDFVYSPAKEYSVGLPEQDKWLTKGILEVNSVFGFSGIIRPSKPYHLVILMGYEVERASSLIDEYEPDKISIGFSAKDENINIEHYNLNLERVEALRKEFPGAESFEFACLDIEAGKLDILNHVDKYQGFNTVISPMNNKLSTISAGLVAFEREEVQLAIAIPALYNTENYSIPSDCFYKFNISNFSK